MNSPDQLWFIAYGHLLDSAQLLEALGQHQPQAERAVFVQHPVYFSGRSRRWGGGVAALDHTSAEGVQTLARAWLIDAAAMEQLARAENAEPELSIDWASADANQPHSLRDRGYGLLLPLGDLDGLPQYTLTSPLPLAERRPAAPGAAYLAAMVTGLRECYGLNVIGLRNYLNGLAGVDPALSHGQVKKLLDAALAELGDAEQN